jgi:hypothetical protein
MKWILWAFLAVIGLAGVLAIVGSRLPVTHEASRSAEFNHAPETVYSLISDLKNYPAWWPENEVNVEVVEAAPPSRFVTRIIGESAFGGTWTWNIEKTAAGSRDDHGTRGDPQSDIQNPRSIRVWIHGLDGGLSRCGTTAPEHLGSPPTRITSRSTP